MLSSAGAKLLLAHFTVSKMFLLEMAIIDLSFRLALASDIML
jgi:hypothetical protein